MTPRLTTLGIALVLAGVGTMVFGDGGVATTLGLVLLTPGVALTTVALVRARAGRQPRPGHRMDEDDRATEARRSGPA